IVLTGASRGLGLAMLEGFVAAGHTVFGCARSPAAMERLGERFGTPHRFTAVDVGDDGSVARWADELRRTAGFGDEPCDLLVNNAAVMNQTRPLWEVPAEEFDALVRVNISGVANMIRHFVPAMVASRRGVIVNF